MKRYTSNKDFTYEEDRFIYAECDNCGAIIENEDDADAHDGICPNCGGDLLNNTSHETCTCAMCGGYFDMWEDAYRHNKTNELICCECYDKLPDSNDGTVVTQEWTFL